VVEREHTAELIEYRFLLIYTAEHAAVQQQSDHNIISVYAQQT
jgi:hypothetical protein